MSNELTATELSLVNAAIANESIAQYGSYDKSEIAAALKLAYSQIGFLSRFGLVDVSHSSVGMNNVIVTIYTFNDRWRLAKKLGSYELLLDYEEQQKDRAAKAKEQSELLTQYQKENAGWQKKYGNKLVVSNIVIAISGLIASTSIAVYLNKGKAPIQNKIEIIIDSKSLNKFYRQQNIDSSKVDGQIHKTSDIP